MGDQLIPGAYWVRAARLLAGPYPTPETLPHLLKAGVEFFIDLTEPDERESYKPLLPDGTWYRQLSISDMGTPPRDFMRRILNTIDAGIVDRRVVYVHCLAGKGRTGTVIGCHLVRYGLTGREALKELIRLREGQTDSPETEPQRVLVENWCENDRSDRSSRWR